jgi:hypothetical protein
MAVANFAKFKITGSQYGLSPSSDFVFRARPGEVLTLELENFQPVQTVTYSLYGTGETDQPLASYQAFNLTFAGGVSSKLVNPASGNTTITMPRTSFDTHSWLLRAVASTADGEHRFERKITYVMGKPDKNIPGETTQGGARGWYDEIAKLIGASFPYYDGRLLTANASATNIPDFNGLTGWTPPASANIFLRGGFTAQQVGSANNFKAWDFVGSWRTDASGIITTISAAVVSLVHDMSAGAFLPGTPTIDIASFSSTRLTPRVTGIAATNINWHAFWDSRIEFY